MNTTLSHLVTEHRIDQYWSTCVASSLGLDDYQDLLSNLTDAFFDLNEGQRAVVWQQVNAAVVAGERDTVKLAEVASVHIHQIALASAKRELVVAELKGTPIESLV